MAFFNNSNMSSVIPVTNESGDFLNLDTWSVVFRASYIFLDFLATLTFNTLTILVTRSVDDFSESTKLLMITLALSDLGVSPVALLSFICEVKGHWPFPSWLQYFHYFCLHTLTSISAVILLCLNVDRFILVTRPFRHASLITKRRVGIMLSLTCVGFVLSGLVLCCINKVSFERSTVLSRLERYDAPTAIYISLVSYFIPLVVVIVCNVRLLMISFSQSRRLRLIGAAPATGPTTDHNQQRVSWMVAVRGKAVFVFSTITFAFAVSWLLYFIELFLILIHSVNYPVWLQFTSAWVAMSNSWWNFAIYGLMNRAFRDSVYKILAKNMQKVQQFFRHQP
ncbi:D(1B) dopamine receptor-like [Acanthaster planci]|uniref:D(1B) dopamine receptor-like n=1 Tax=Acanthaster planci TaxID=133434 RepID=A0A8B7YKJ9_ACAPL|nr:D(1B) dopamine receptor-like [Acanthaster planci]